MSRIPKSAQRAIDKANRQRDLERLAQVERLASLPVPRRMDVNFTPRSIINLHDVFFNGEKQTLCVMADAVKGIIHRWSHGTGHRPGKGAVIQELQGKVEIRRKV